MTAITRRVPGPFTVPLIIAGIRRWNVTLDLAGLPDLPRGSAPGYVPWVLP